MNPIKFVLSKPTTSVNERSTLVVRLDGFLLFGEDWTFMPYLGSCLLSGLDFPNVSFQPMGLLKGYKQFDKMRVMQIPLWNHKQVPGPLSIMWIGKETKKLRKTAIFKEFRTVVRSFIDDSIMALSDGSPTRRNRQYNTAEIETIRICSQEDWIELAKSICSKNLKENFLTNKTLKNVFEGETFVFIGCYELGQNVRVQSETDLQRLFLDTDITKCSLVAFHWAFDWQSITPGSFGKTNRFFDVTKIKNKLANVSICREDMDVFNIGLFPYKNVGNIQVNQVPANDSNVSALNMYKRNGSDLKAHEIASFTNFKISEYLELQVCKILDRFYLMGVIPTRNQVEAPSGPCRRLLEEGGDTDFSELHQLLSRLQLIWTKDNACRIEVIVWHDILQIPNPPAIYRFAKISLDKARDWLEMNQLFHPQDTLLEFSRVEINQWSSFVIKSCSKTLENSIELVKRIRKEPDLLTAGLQLNWKFDCAVLVNLKCSELILGWFQRGNFEHTKKAEKIKQFLGVHNLSNVTTNGDYLLQISPDVDQMQESGLISVEPTKANELLKSLQPKETTHWTLSNGFFAVERVRDVFPKNSTLLSVDFLKKLLLELVGCLRADPKARPGDENCIDSYRRHQRASKSSKCIEVISIDTLLDRLNSGKQIFNFPFAASWYVYVKDFVMSNKIETEFNKGDWDVLFKEILVRVCKEHQYPLVFGTRRRADSNAGSSKKITKKTLKEISYKEYAQQYLIVVPLPGDIENDEMSKLIITRTVAFQGPETVATMGWIWLDVSYQDLLPCLTNNCITQTMEILVLKYEKRPTSELSLGLNRLVKSVNNKQAADKIRHCFLYI